MRKIVAFYAWQSDTPEKFNRKLIRIALEDAAKRITNDPTIDVQLIVDYDTEGVPGTPPISQTILNKIDACDIFIPDVSFVARTEAGKFVPNPNVMTEYGYALHAKSHAAMMPIMNTQFGPPEELPFDMGHLRFPIQYHAEADAADGPRRAVRRALSQQLEEKLRLQIAATQPPAPEPTPFPEASSSGNPAIYFQPSEVLANAGYPGEQEYRIDGEKLVYLRLFPCHAGKPLVSLSKLTNVFNTRRPCPMSMALGGLASRNQWGPIIYDPGVSPRNIAGLTQGFATGELWGINAQMFVHRGRHNVSGADIWRISAIGLEKLYVHVLRNYVRIASSELALALPYTVEFGAVGMEGAYLLVPGGPISQGEFVGPFMQPYIQKRYSLTKISDDEIKMVLRNYFVELYDLAACNRAEVLTDNHVTANDLPPR